MTIKTEYAPGEFCWVDLMAKEMDAAKAWYADLFGWTYEEQDTGGGPRYGQFYKDGKVVAGLGQMGEEMKGAGMPSMWNSYVSVEDVGAVATRAAELGGSVMMPAMDVMDVGKMAILQSPEGAALAVWQPGKHVGAALCNADGAFCWNELSTRDLEGSASFFGKLFGWDVRDPEPEYADGPAKMKMIFNGERENGHMLEMTEEWGDMPPSWAVYFAVADIDATVAKAKELGGTVPVPATPIPVGTFAVIADPQGGHFYAIQLNELPD